MKLCNQNLKPFIVYHLRNWLQALECDLLNEFLSILDSPLQEVESPAGCKALIVKAVKAMQCSLLYGEQISTILKDSQVSVKLYENSNENYIIPQKINCTVYVTRVLLFIGVATICSAKAWLISHWPNKPWWVDL